MPTEIKGVLGLRKALKNFEPDLAKETTKEIATALRVVTSKAKGFVPSVAQLSGWNNQSALWEYRAFNASEIKSGIKYKSTPSKPNRKGFRALASIYNASAAGAIYETAGRKNPQGRPPAPLVKHYTDAGTPRARFEGKYIRSGDKNNSLSRNPHAGQQFIDALPPLVDSRQSNTRGRRTRKTKGRLIFRAWAEDQGRTTAAVIKAIETSGRKFNERRSQA
jgi:hypothetical protein